MTQDLLALLRGTERPDRPVRVPDALVGAVRESRVVPISTLGEGRYLLGGAGSHLNVRRRSHGRITRWYRNLGDSRGILSA